ncbi:MAG: DUF5915 domain-containing protein [Nanoarchaeota archaeon]
MAERDKEKIGLRWPLSKAIVKASSELNKDFKEIIKRQLNVKNVEIKKADTIEVKLDTKITLELEAEGFARELARKIQDERKKAGLEKKDFIELKIFMDKEEENMLKQQFDFLKSRTNAKKIEILSLGNKEGFMIKDKKFAVEFEKV